MFKNPSDRNNYRKKEKVTNDVEKIPFLHKIFLLGEMVTSKSFKTSLQIGQTLKSALTGFLQESHNNRNPPTFNQENKGSRDKVTDNIKLDNR